MALSNFIKEEDFIQRLYQINYKNKESFRDYTFEQYRKSLIKFLFPKNCLGRSFSCNCDEYSDYYKIQRALLIYRDKCFLKVNKFKMKDEGLKREYENKFFTKSIENLSKKFKKKPSIRR